MSLQKNKKIMLWIKQVKNNPFLLILQKKKSKLTEYISMKHLHESQCTKTNLVTKTNIFASMF